VSDWHDCPQPGPSPEEVLEEARGQAFDAGYKAGLAEARTKIEGLRANAPAWPDDDSYEAGLDAALASLESDSDRGEVQD